MKIEHNSRKLIYRKPFGAVCCGEKVNLSISLTDFGIPSHIRLVYEYAGKVESVNMAYVYEMAGAYVYEAGIVMPEKPGLLHYYFDIAGQYGRIYYGGPEDNLGGEGCVYEEEPNHKFQITIYDKNFQTPQWWRNSVCYQIFPDRFYNGNDDKEFLGDRKDIIRRGWGEEPFYKAEQFGGEYLANDFFGGNLAGIEEKLPYMADLGISAIYLNPIFKAYSNHKYDTGNYMEIDPMFGTEDDFVRLCTSAEKYGIRIILDGVFNHVGSDSIYFNKKGTYNSVGAYQSEQSRYHSWFRFSSFPDEYESWWGIDTLPQIEEKSEDYQNYVLKDDDAVVKHWLKTGASGWRLDVVDELPDFFVKILRQEIKKQDPDAVIIGEVWEDASNKIAYDEQRQYFMGAELDSVMNYPLRSAIIDYVMGHINAAEFDRRIMSLKENYPPTAFYATLNFLSSHDVERIITAMSGEEHLGKDEQNNYYMSEEIREIAKKRLRIAISMQILFPGVPCIFYGDEAGLEGYGDPFCRRCFPWGKMDEEIYGEYKKNIKLRNENGALRGGEFETVYMVDGGYGFIRYDSDDSFIILVNPKCDTTFRLDAARFGIHRICGVFHDESYSSEDGIYYVHMPEISVKVFKAIK